MRLKARVGVRLLEAASQKFFPHIGAVSLKEGDGEVLYSSRFGFAKCPLAKREGVRILAAQI